MRWKRVAGAAGALILVGTLVAIVLVARTRAREFLTNPRETRAVALASPADYHVPFEDVTVTTRDQLRLVGWYLPSKNGAAIILQHGYKNSRDVMLKAAVMYASHGYGVLVDTVRAHDRSDGEWILFGHSEMQDLSAWFAMLAARPDVNPKRIALVGASMGGSLVIQYGAENPAVAAVVADCAFSSLDDTIDTSVRSFTGLPAFPFAPLIKFWAQRAAGFDVAEIDAKRWIGRISPRPVFLMQGGADKVISVSSGQLLYDAAGEPKTLWYDEHIGHAEFFGSLPQEYERRVIGFLDDALR